MRRMMMAVLVALAFATPQDASAQIEWQRLFDAAASRSAGMRILVFDPNRTREEFDPNTGLTTTVADSGFAVLSIENLLAGLVRFPDNHRRYVAVRSAASPLDPAPTFTEANFLAADSATSVVGWGIGVDVPSDSISTQSGWVGVAVPVAAGDVQFLNLQSVNDGQNQIALFAQQANVTIDGVECVVWVTGSRTLVLGFSNIYFDALAAEPTP